MFAWIGQAVTPRHGVSCVYLASLADAAPFSRCPGVSSRAMRSALRMMGRRWYRRLQLCVPLERPCEGWPARHGAFTARAGQDAVRYWSQATGGALTP